jgi:hypothetical protein
VNACAATGPPGLPGRIGRQNTTTERIDSPACMRSKPLLISSSERVGDHRVDLDLAVHVPVDDLRHVGAAARAAERGALPDPPGDQLERPGGDLGPAGATPMMIDWPQPRWQASSAWRITVTLPVQSKV